MNPYPAVLVDGPWTVPDAAVAARQDETVRRLKAEVERRDMELRAAAVQRLKPKPWALRAVVDVLEEGEWQ